jgi:hypothetical protein
MAFYDFCTRREMITDEIIRKPIAFKVNVMHDAIKSGRWPIVGNKPLEAEMMTPVHFSKQDVIDKNRISIYWQVERGPDVVEVPATFEECIGLEPGVVWYADHLEDRLRDHFAKRLCKWLESLKLSRPPDR